MSAATTAEPAPAPMPGPRLRTTWIVATAVALLAMAGVYILSAQSEDRLEQDQKNVFSFILLGGALVFNLGWLLYRSRLVRRTKLQIVAAALLAVAAFLTFVKMEFSGDMHVTFSWRFAPTSDAKLDVPIAQGIAPAVEPADTDFPQFLGPRRDGVIRGVQLDRDWKAHPPKQLWRKAAGAGWSGFVVAGPHAYTLEQYGDQRAVVCYNVEQGDVVWSVTEEGRYTSVLGGDGPRSTPTIAGDKLYVQWSEGELDCLDRTTGERIWRRDILADNDASNIEWGRSGSPLVVDGKVIVSAGGPNGKSLVAYDQTSGEIVWRGGDDQASYASPMLATIGGIEQVLVVNEARVVGHRLSDGSVLWSHEWPGQSNGSANTSQPVPLPGDMVFVSKGYGQGCELLKIVANGQGTFAVESQWRKPALMKTKMTNVVVQGDHLYGLSGGVLECINWRLGERKWKNGRYGHGQVLLVGDVLLVTIEEEGDVALVDASPEKFHELGRFDAIDGKTWNIPALAGNRLLIRNHLEAACYELPLVPE